MGKIKIIIMAAVLISMIALTSVAYVGAKHRALVTHCKNNLRKLAQLSLHAVRETITHVPSGDEKVGISTEKDSLDELLIISHVHPNSPAKAAGLQIGDKIKTIDDQEFKESEDLDAYLSKKKPGDVIKILVLRSGDELLKTINVTKKQTGKSGRKFWVELWEREKTIKQPINPLCCPFTGHTYNETMESIDYRGPARLDSESGIDKEKEIIIAADRHGNHGHGNGGNVAVIKIRMIKQDHVKHPDFTIMIHTCSDNDPLWSAAAIVTTD